MGLAQAVLPAGAQPQGRLWRSRAAWNLSSSKFRNCRRWWQL
jgi:hypothetical protein